MQHAICVGPLASVATPLHRLDESTIFLILFVHIVVVRFNTPSHYSCLSHSIVSLSCAMAEDKVRTRPWKQTMTEKAKEASLAKSKKRVRSANAAAAPKGKGTHPPPTSSYRSRSCKLMYSCYDIIVH